MITRNLKQYANHLSQYTELRVQENRTLNITFLNGNMVGNSKNSNNGVSARVYKGGAWGFASSSEMDEAHVKEVLKAAENNALFLNSRTNRDRKFFDPTVGHIEKDFRTTKNRMSQSEIKEFLKEIDNYIVSKYPGLTQRVVALRSLSMEKSLMTSDQSTFYSFIPKVAIIVSLTIVKDGKPVEIYEAFGGLGEFEDNFSEPSVLYEKIDTLHKELIDKSEGVRASVGLKECVLDASLSGMLAHEAIGHTTEADLVLGGSIAGEYMNKEVASPLVTLLDIAHTFDGKLCPMPIFMDDEGTVAEDVTIIEDGILRNYMHNKNTAARFNAAPKGNARAFQYNDEPLVRMRNTGFLPGKDKLEDLISSVEDGYYLIKTGNGQADTTSEFTFSVNMGYEIKNGKLGRAIKDTTITGVAFDVLKTVSMVSDTMHWDGFGMCGKKQPIPVGMGGPAIKCKVKIGGE